MDEKIEELERDLLARAFLYEDPESFRYGVRETLRAIGTERPAVETKEPADAVA